MKKVEKMIIELKAKRMILVYGTLDLQSQFTYGNNFDILTKKEKLEICYKLIKEGVQ